MREGVRGAPLGGLFRIKWQLRHGGLLYCVTEVISPALVICLLHQSKTDHLGNTVLQPSMPKLPLNQGARWAGCSRRSGLWKRRRVSQCELAGAGIDNAALWLHGKMCRGMASSHGHGSHRHD